MAAVCCSRLGRRDRGLDWARQASTIDPDDAGVCYNVACLLALEGERDDAIEHLQRATRVGFAHRDWIAHDPDLASLHGDPRFQELTSGRHGQPT
jgi:adenylate cyclase